MSHVVNDIGSDDVAMANEANLANSDDIARLVIYGENLDHLYS